MKETAKKISFALFLSLFSLLIAQGQNSGVTKKPSEPILVALTEEEKKLNAKSILENQPDFTAVQNYFSAREVSGFSASSKVARKGKKYRVDTGFVVVIAEPNKPTLRLNQNKTYEEGIGIRKPFISATSPLNPTDLLGFEDISFSLLGTIELEGDKLIKIQAKSKEFEQEVFLYANLGKKNLITIIQILSPQRSSIQRLIDISFEVPNAFFDISDYKALPKFNWKKIKNAKIIYDGESVKDGVAFQYDKYIFVHAGEFSHILINVESKIAITVVYRGLLLSKDGYYIWQTQEEEAISVGELDQKFNQKDCEDCVKAIIETNSITIPDKKNKSRILAKISW